MRRWIYLALGVPLAAAGLGCAVVSLAVPWARYHVTGTAVGDRPIADDAPVAVFQVSGGTWYVLAVFALGGLLAGAALGGPRSRPAITVAASIGGLLTAFLVVLIENRVAASSGGVLATGLAEVHAKAFDGPGIRFGLAAGPLLGFGAALVAAGRRLAPATRSPASAARAEAPS
jgi:hypothetical protein